MSASRETGTSGVDSCSEYQENVDLLGRFSSLSSETEDRAGIMCESRTTVR